MEGENGIMEKNFIKTEHKNTIFYITLNRPEKRNAVTFDMVGSLAEAVDEAMNAPGIRGIILSGAGKLFSAGLDFSAAASLFQSSQEKGAFITNFRSLIKKAQHALNALEEIEIPVIAAVNRLAVGLGLEIALACDLRIVSEDCELGLPEAKLGLVADVGGTTRLCRAVGSARAKELIFTGRNVTAQEALSIGLVNKVVPADKLIAEAEDLIARISKSAPLAVGLTKRIINKGDSIDKMTQMELEVWSQSLLIQTEDFMEGAMSFMERREPKFKGK